MNAPPTILLTHSSNLLYFFFPLIFFFGVFSFLIFSCRDREYIFMYTSVEALPFDVVGGSEMLPCVFQKAESIEE